MNDFDPGIVDIVEALNTAGFDTTDSGDGWSKPRAFEVMPFAHVAIVCAGVADIAVVAGAVLLELRRLGELTAKVEASYDPADQSLLILASWPGPRGQPADGAPPPTCPMTPAEQPTALADGEPAVREAFAAGRDSIDVATIALNAYGAGQKAAIADIAEWLRGDGKPHIHAHALEIIEGYGTAVRVSSELARMLETGEWLRELVRLRRGEP